jgi:hypothetical protein
MTRPAAASTRGRVETGGRGWHLVMALVASGAAALAWKADGRLVRTPTVGKGTLS